MIIFQSCTILSMHSKERQIVSQLKLKITISVHKMSLERIKNQASLTIRKTVNGMYKCNLHCNGQSIEKWVETGFGTCDPDPNCFLNQNCECLCPDKWDVNVTFLPPDNPLYKHLDSKCRNHGAHCRQWLRGFVWKVIFLLSLII